MLHGITQLPLSSEVAGGSSNDFAAMMDLFRFCATAMGTGPVAKDFGAGNQLLGVLTHLVSTHRALMGSSSDYTPHIEPVSVALATFNSMIVQSEGGIDDFLVCGVTRIRGPFVDVVKNYSATCGRDIGKAKETINSDLHERLHSKITAVRSIAGGASNGKFWYAGVTDHNPDAIMERFDETLGKLDFQQIVSASMALQEALTNYKSARGDDDTSKKLVHAAGVAFLCNALRNWRWSFVRTIFILYECYIIIIMLL